MLYRALLIVCCFSSTALSQTKKIDFAHDIVPLLKSRCAECHTNGTYKGGFSLDTRTEAKKSDVKEITRRITSDDPEVRMPSKGKPLTPAEVALLKSWIDEGLPWEPGFSFKVSTYVAPLKPRRPTLPVAQNGREHPIDRIIDAYFVTNKLPRPAPLDDLSFIRRVHFDIIGLLPTPTEVDAFIADGSADKRAKLVRRLLDDQRGFADHWLAFWNDLLRNDYAGTGFIDGGRKQISAFLYQSLLTNKPYDQFVRELISPTPDSEGFIKGIKWRGSVNASQVVELQFAQNVGQVFFGANMKCASCHDSFIDKWKLDDAYSLAAVIADAPLEVHRCDKPQGRKATPRFLFPELGTIDAKLPKPKRLEQMAALVTHADNGRFTRTIANRIWHRFMGRGIVHPVDVMGNPPWSSDLLDYLAVYLADNKYDLKKFMEHILTSQAYQSKVVQIAKEPAGDEYIYRGPEMKRIGAEPFIDALWMITQTAPTKPVAPIPFPPFAESTPTERRFVRATLVNADLLMRSLGRPNREQVVTTRPDLLSTLQALDLSNGPIITDTLNRGATKLLQSNKLATSDDLIAIIYRQALSRRPTGDEMAILRELVGPKPSVEGIADLLWTVLMLPEFQLIR